MYKLIYAAGQSLRKRNYRLFRRIVENPLVRGLVRSAYGDKLITVHTPEGDALSINPVFHGNFLSEDSILAYEPEMRRLFDMAVSTDMVVYDVGANVGVFSLYFLHLVGEGGYVHAFEPEPNNLRCLLSTRANNRFGNFEVHPVGVGRASETLYFDRRGGAMSGRLVDSADGRNDNVTEMTVVSIDDFVFGQGNRPPDLLKIDVEGHETAVIEGMQRTLKEVRPVIVCELHHALEPGVIHIFDVLDGFGYASYEVSDYLSGNQRQPLTGYAGVHHIIAVPRPLAS